MTQPDPESTTAELRQTIRSAMESVKPLQYKWTEHDDAQIENVMGLLASELKRIGEEVIGEDEELQMPAPGWDNHKAVERSVGRNQERAEARQRLTKAIEGLTKEGIDNV